MINKKIFDVKILYKDAIYYHLIHSGYSYKKAKFLVEKILNMENNF